jgi:hypothetical protein
MVARTEDTAPVTPISKFERFFRVVAELDVDKNDLRRLHDFIQSKTFDFLVRGDAAAKANGRDIIQPHDLPVTKGLQECIQQFKKIDAVLQIRPGFDRATPRPPLLTYSADTDEQLALIVGGLSVALARSFRIIDPELRNPSTPHWERAFRLFDLLL